MIQNDSFPGMSFRILSIPQSWITYVQTTQCRSIISCVRSSASIKESESSLFLATLGDVDLESVGDLQFTTYSYSSIIELKTKVYLDTLLLEKMVEKIWGNLWTF